jgi:hypothetical protein
MTKQEYDFIQEALTHKIKKEGIASINLDQGYNEAIRTVKSMLHQMYSFPTGGIK